MVLFLFLLIRNDFYLEIDVRIKKKKDVKFWNIYKIIVIYGIDSGFKILGIVEIVLKRLICYGYLVDFVLSKYIYI